MTVPDAPNERNRDDYQGSNAETDIDDANVGGWSESPHDVETELGDDERLLFDRLKDA